MQMLVSSISFNQHVLPVLLYRLFTGSHEVIGESVPAVKQRLPSSLVGQQNDGIAYFLDEHLGAVDR